MPPTRASRRTRSSRRRWACCGSAARRNEAILPRHGHGPQPQVVDGRLFLEGSDLIRCTRYLHRPPAVGGEAAGRRQVLQQHAHSARRERDRHQLSSRCRRRLRRLRPQCLRLDPATGKTTKELRLREEGNRRRGLQR